MLLAAKNWWLYLFNALYLTKRLLPQEAGNIHMDILATLWSQESHIIIQKFDLCRY